MKHIHIRYPASTAANSNVFIFRYVVALLFLIVTPLSRLQAQPYSSTPAEFTVSQIKGCARFTVTISDATCDGSISCTVIPAYDPAVQPQNQKNTKALVLSTTITYDSAGTYRLAMVRGSIFSYVDITVVPNIKPAYDLYSCDGNKVALQVTDTNYDTYFIDYHDGTTLTVPSGSGAKDVHTYVGTGVRTVDVKGINLNADNNCDNSTQTVEVDATLLTPAITQLTVTSGSQIQLDFSSTPPQLNSIYKTEIAVNKNTGFQQLKNVHNVTTTTADNLKTDDNYYCFRMTTFDYCTSTPGAVYSNVICSNNFDVAAASDVNKLTWVTNNTGVTDFSITKTPGTALTAPASASSLDDTDVICNTSYNYQLTSNYANGSKSISLQKSVTAFSSVVPSLIENTTAIVNSSGAGVELQWVPDPGFTAKEYSIFKVTSFSSLLKKTTVPDVTDSAYTTGGNTCYILSYSDACNNNSPPSASVCPIQLTGALQADNSVNLSWPPYNGWKNGVAGYTIEKYSSSGSLLQTFSVNGTTTSLLDNAQDLDNQVYVYVVKANPVDGGLGTSVSNTIKVIKNPNLFYPTAFTPDHQGPVENEVFKVFGQYVQEFEMKIFNRWGELLYSTTNLSDSWDGTFKGNPMPEGTYAFIATITDDIGRTFHRSGSVVLLRKN